MSNKVPFQRKYAVLAGALLATGSLALAPIAVPAFAAKPVGEAKSLSRSWLGTFTPSGVDSRLAEKFAANARNINGRFPFTPAGVDAARSRTMTVAARTDSPLTAGAVSVRNAIGSIQPGANKAVTESGLPVAHAALNLANCPSTAASLTRAHTCDRACAGLAITIVADSAVSISIVFVVMSISCC